MGRADRGNDFSNTLQAFCDRMVFFIVRSVKAGKEQTNDRRLSQGMSLELAYAEVAISYNKRTMRGSFRTGADSITGNKAERSGWKKRFNVNFIVKAGVFLYN